MTPLPLKAKLGRIAGIGFTALSTLFILWAGFTLISGHSGGGDTQSLTAVEMEPKVVPTLKQIAAAQETYVKTDRNEDGKTEYALFLVHLYRSVSEKDSRPIEVGLISESLAFCSLNKIGLHGYQYEILTQREGSPDLKDDHNRRIGIPLDFTNEWAAVAYPIVKGDPKETGRTFVLLSTGDLYAKATGGHELNWLPKSFVDDGWTRL